MLLNSNVLSTWARDVYNPTLGTTGPPQTTLVDLLAHAAVVPSTQFHELPAAARKVSYVFQIDAGTDVVTGDYLTRCVDSQTGAGWPFDYPLDPSDAGYGNTLWIVRYHQESTPGPISYRALFVEKIILGGPASPNG